MNYNSLPDEVLDWWQVDGRVEAGLDESDPDPSADEIMDHYRNALEAARDAATDARIDYMRGK